MNLRKSLPPPWNRRVLVSTGAYRRYLLHSLGSIHGDMLDAIGRWVDRGAVVWDVGANMGIFAFAAAIRAGAAGKVYAFEADVDCASLVTRSQCWRLPDEASVTICPFAVANKSGSVAFEISNYRTAASAIRGFGRFRAGGTVREVPAFSVDDLAETFTPPTVLKIDVEGAENLVLEGARQTLQRHRPLLLIECSGGEIGMETGRFFQSIGYKWKPWMSDAAFGEEGIPGGDLVAQPG